jgi:hypothetical protein
MEGHLKCIMVFMWPFVNHYIMEHAGYRLLCALYGACGKFWLALTGFAQTPHRHLN